MIVGKESELRSAMRDKCPEHVRRRRGCPTCERISAALASRIPAEVFPVGIFILEEMKARGWTTHKVAALMRGPTDVNELAIELTLYAPTKGVLLGEDMGRDLARVFGTSEDYWLNLDKAWQQDSYHPTAPHV